MTQTPPPRSTVTAYTPTPTYTDVLRFVCALSGHLADQCVGFELGGLDYCLALHAVCPGGVDLAKLSWVPQPTPKQLESNIDFFLRCARACERPTCRFPGSAVAAVAALHAGASAAGGVGGAAGATASAASASRQPEDEDDDVQGHPSLMTFNARALRPTKQCFMHHMQVQRWLYLMQATPTPTPTFASADSAAPPSVSAATLARLAAHDAQQLRRQHAMPVPLSLRCPAELAELFELVAAEKAGYRACWREVERALVAMLARDAQVDMKRLQAVLAQAQPTRAC